MSTLHCFVRGTLTNPEGPETEVWVNIIKVNSIMADADGGSHVLLGDSSTSLHLHESPVELMDTATYLTPATQTTAPIYFGGEEN